MDSTSVSQVKELLDAQVHIWKHVLNFLSSMALKCAVELSIPDVIKIHGKPMSVSELATSLSIHANKVASLHRLMRLLESLDFFSTTILSTGEEAFALTSTSQLLLKDHPLTQAPVILGILQPQVTQAPHHLSDWFRNAVDSPFLIAHGRTFWEHTGYDQDFNYSFNHAMESDSRLVTKFLVSSRQFKGLLEGVESMVDVGGGNGTTAKAIVEAYPGLTCTVLDLPHVVAGLQDDVIHVNYVAGDMFEKVPNADVVLLKWILHNWSDEDCVKILQNCKEAIPRKHEGGKVIIIDMIIDPENKKSKSSSAKLLMDMQMMSLLGRGKERTKEEWEKLFVKAGFGDCKFYPIEGFRSVIDVYPL